MAPASEPEVVLYDLNCNKNECFSPAVWRIRLMLNYKKISYRTVFLEFPDIEPTLKELGLEPNEKGKYTVPAIYHVPTNTYMMDSVPISKFLETTYPDPPVQLTSELGDKVVAQLWAAASSTFRASIMPREVNILYPRSAEYFRRTHMGGLADLSPKELLDPQKEDEAWKAVDGSMREAGEMMQKNKADGPFVLGASPSYADFKIVAALQSGRMVDEGIFQRMVAYPGFKEVYKACEPYREKRN